MAATKIKLGEIIQEKEEIDVLADLYIIHMKAGDIQSANRMKDQATQKFGKSKTDKVEGFK